MRMRHTTPRSAAVSLLLCAVLAGCGDALSTEPAPDPGSASTLAAADGKRQAPRVRINGKAHVIDENGSVFTTRIAVSADRNRKGNTLGTLTMVFDPGFSAVWGAEPGIHRIHLRGEITSVARDDGKVVLTGTLTETDVARGRPNLVFPNEPFELVISGHGTLTLVWCELPPFRLEMPRGLLVY